MDSARGKTRDEATTKLAERIDSFEKYAQPHARIISELAARLAQRLGLAPSDINAVAEASLLHDIGMYAQSPPYAAVPGPLSFEERLDLWRHPIIGEQQMAKRAAPRHSQLLVRWHHEWWNGSGYPDMLAFEDIPIGARILRAIDLFSSLTADRPYRAALGWDEAVEALKSSAGIECDPYVVTALLALLDDMRHRQEEVSLPPDEPTQAPQPEPSGDSRFATNPEMAIPAVLEFPKPADESPAPQSQDQDQPAEPGDIAPVVSEPTPEKLARLVAAVEASRETGQRLPSIESLLAHAETEDEAPRWRGWRGTAYNKKSLLGFEASVLRQLEFRSVAIALSGWARLGWYLKMWGKVVFANDPRAWAAAVTRALIEAPTPPGDEHLARLLEDVYVPGYNLSNPALRRWFGETDAWWLDNLRRNINALDDEYLRAQAFMLGMQAGDYALSFTEETRELKRPLTAVFRRLATRAVSGTPGHLHNRSFNLPIEEFIQQARGDLLYLDLPAAHTEQAGDEARSQWRESWVRGAGDYEPDDLWKLATLPQSKQAYLVMLDRLLRAARHVRTWAVGYQEVGLVSARDISELIKEHRPVRATYSKDLTEVAGGLRSYIIVADKA